MSTAEQLAFKAAMRLMTHADIPGGSLWDVTTVREKSLMLKAWYAARAATAQPAQPAGPEDQAVYDAMAANYFKSAQAPAQAAEPVAQSNWRQHVEERIRSWRQRTMNKSGDCLAIDDYMGKDDIDDLVDYVCDEWAGPPSEPAATGRVGPKTMTTQELRQEIGRLQQELTLRVCGDPVASVGLRIGHAGSAAPTGEAE